MNTALTQNALTDPRSDNMHLQRISWNRDSLYQIPSKVLLMKPNTLRRHVDCAHKHRQNILEIFIDKTIYFNTREGTQINVSASK